METQIITPNKHWATVNPFKLFKGYDQPTAVSNNGGRDTRGPHSSEYCVAAVWFSQSRPEPWTQDHYIIGWIPERDGCIFYSTCTDQDYWITQAKLLGADQVWTRPIVSVKRVEQPLKRRRAGKISLDTYKKICNSWALDGVSLKDLGKEYGLSSQGIRNLIHEPPGYIREQLDAETQPEYTPDA